MTPVRYWLFADNMSRDGVQITTVTLIVGSKFLPSVFTVCVPGISSMFVCATCTEV